MSSLGIAALTFTSSRASLSLWCLIKRIKFRLHHLKHFFQTPLKTDASASLSGSWERPFIYFFTSSPHGMRSMWFSSPQKMREVEQMVGGLTPLLLLGPSLVFTPDSQSKRSRTTHSGRHADGGVSQRLPLQISSEGCELMAGTAWKKANGNTVSWP